MKPTIEILQARIRNALVAAFGDEYADADPMLVPASNPKFGDYQSNAALSLAKRLRQKPRAIAEQIVEQLEIAPLCEEATVAGPGFINLSLQPSYLEAQLQTMTSDPHLGIERVQQPQKVVIDFSSPNIATGVNQPTHHATLRV